MKVEVVWSESEQVMLLLPQDVVLSDAASVAEFRNMVVPMLKKCGKRVPLVICIDGMLIKPCAAHHYGEVAKEVVSYATAFARYGAPSTVAMIIASEALRNGMRSNIFDNRADAVHFARTNARKKDSA